MRTRHALVVISAAQLAAGVAGQLVAVRDRRSFDIALIGWRGRPNRVAHDTWLLGTGLSAPVTILATQAVATARLSRGPSRGAARTLGVLGVMMSAGYLVEAEVRRALSPAGRDREVTPIVLTGLTLAGAMGVLGLRGVGRQGQE
jgi:hypothetical protein